MFQTGYHATGYYQTAYHLGAEQQPEQQLPLSDHYGGGGDYAIFPTPEDRERERRERIERDDMEIIALVMAAVDAGIIR